MKVLLLWLMSDEFVDISNHRADIHKVDAQIYINEDEVDAFCKRMVTVGPFDKCLIPDQYEGELFIHTKYHESLKQHPNHSNGDLDYWSIIESHLPNYNQNQEVSDRNDISRYLNGEMDMSAQSDIDLVDHILAFQPTSKYLTDKEWAFHQMAKIDTNLFHEAITI